MNATQFKFEKILIEKALFGTRIQKLPEKRAMFTFTQNNPFQVNKFFEYSGKVGKQAFYFKVQGKWVFSTSA